MKFLNSQRIWLIAGVLACAVILGLVSSSAPGVLAQEGGIGPFALNVPSNSSPIAFANNVVWVVNPDDDSISLIDANSDTFVKKVFVGDEP
ncbi:MAG TPA: hypothetical protein VEC96_16960, partial [Anaerolineae bacterium]|nr:hypothetical protein [Anaerolineae bacterium]